MRVVVAGEEAGRRYCQLALFTVPHAVRVAPVRVRVRVRRDEVAAVRAVLVERRRYGLMARHAEKLMRLDRAAAVGEWEAEDERRTAEVRRVEQHRLARARRDAAGAGSAPGGGADAALESPASIGGFAEARVGHNTSIDAGPSASVDVDPSAPIDVNPGAPVDVDPGMSVAVGLSASVDAGFSAAPRRPVAATTAPAAPGGGRGRGFPAGSRQPGDVELAGL